MKMVYLGLGSNMDQPERQLAKARYLIGDEIGPILNQSSLYQTEAWGIEDQPDFLNQVVQLETDLPPRQLLQRILDMELRMGRIRDRKWGARRIDIDILIYSNEIVSDPELQIPHPHLQERNFVLTPLVEIAPHLIHPLLNQSLEALLKQSPDKLLAKRV